MASSDVSPESVREEIAREMLRVHDEAYGETSARDAKVYLMDDITLVVIDAVPTPAEQILLDAGRGDAVRGTREAFQEAIAPTFTAIVERATGRRVISFLSRMALEPFESLEYFRLGADE
jgi:uncharacterized protein YbcI